MLVGLLLLPPRTLRRRRTGLGAGKTSAQDKQPALICSPRTLVCSPRNCSTQRHRETNLAHELVLHAKASGSKHGSASTACERIPGLREVLDMVEVEIVHRHTSTSGQSPRRHPRRPTALPALALHRLLCHGGEGSTPRETTHAHVRDRAGDCLTASAAGNSTKHNDERPGRSLSIGTLLSFRRCPAAPWQVHGKYPEGRHTCFPQVPGKCPEGLCKCFAPEASAHRWGRRSTRLGGEGHRAVIPNFAGCTESCSKVARNLGHPGRSRRDARRVCNP